MQREKKKLSREVRESEGKLKKFSASFILFELTIDHKERLSDQLASFASRIDACFRIKKNFGSCQWFREKAEDFRRVLFGKIDLLKL